MQSFKTLRDSAREIGEILRDEPDCPWYPLSDREFWDALDAIEEAIGKSDAPTVHDLFRFVLIDDLGPLGRGMILARAALLSLSTMGKEIAADVETVASAYETSWPYYKKVGLVKLLQTAQTAPESAIWSLFEQDPDERIRARIASIRQLAQG